PMRRAATVEATENITTSASAIQIELEMIPVRMTLKIASCNAPRRIAVAGDHAARTRNASSTPVVRAASTTTPTTEGRSASSVVMSVRSGPDRIGASGALRPRCCLRRRGGGSIDDGIQLAEHLAHV